MVKFLGREGFGNVMLVKKMSASTCGCRQDLFAMKAVCKDVISKRRGVKMWVEKQVFMRAVGHPFLVQLHDYFQTMVHHSF
jgi:hypothetical protein